ncbi:MAG TPA: GspH/FimT family pseudopilin [Nitrospirota bacterium]|nr:GspH/FimT family pseudopilin [Nitrospirota bacterium]
MKTGNMQKLIPPDKGYTVIEMVVVIAIISTITAIALPPYVQWRQSVQYRSTARSIAAMMRDARSRAISNNSQYRVEFQTPTAAVAQYRMTQGNLSSNSSTWNTVQSWSQIISGVTLTLQNVTMPVPENCPSNSNCIDFYPNGTVNLNALPPADIQVMDSTNTLRFTVEVSNAGRIRVF